MAIRLLPAGELQADTNVIMAKKPIIMGAVNRRIMYAFQIRSLLCGSNNCAKTLFEKVSLKFDYLEPDIETLA